MCLYGNYMVSEEKKTQKEDKDQQLLCEGTKKEEKIKDDFGKEKKWLPIVTFGFFFLSGFICNYHLLLRKDEWLGFLLAKGEQ